MDYSSVSAMPVSSLQKTQRQSQQSYRYCENQMGSALWNGFEMNRGCAHTLKPDRARRPFSNSVVIFRLLTWSLHCRVRVAPSRMELTSSCEQLARARWSHLLQNWRLFWSSLGTSSRASLEAASVCPRKSLTRKEPKARKADTNSTHALACPAWLLQAGQIYIASFGTATSKRACASSTLRRAPNPLPFPFDRCRKTLNASTGSVSSSTL